MILKFIRNFVKNEIFLPFIDNSQIPRKENVNVLDQIGRCQRMKHMLRARTAADPLWIVLGL